MSHVCRYFAFGSNLDRDRLEARIGEVEVVGVGTLAGYRLVVSKPGLDGSAKANVVAANEVVWGVVYAIPDGELPALDGYEGGYERVEVSVDVEGDAVRCWTYVAEGHTDDLPFDWYKAHMVRGAEAHGLPVSWRQRLRNIAAKPSK